MVPKSILITIAMLTMVCCNFAFSQHKKPVQNADRIKIEKKIIDFLKWDKSIEQGVHNAVPKNSAEAYLLTKGGAPDSTTNVRIDFEGVEKYISLLRKTQLFSESCLNDVRQYYQSIDSTLVDGPKTKYWVKINGMDIDIFLMTYDTDDILNNINKVKFDLVYIIYNKALVRFTISKSIKMIYSLTRIRNNWFIDDIGYDNTYQYSIGSR